MLPESPKESMSPVEKETGKALSKLKSQVDQPWKIMYLRESTDQKYKIYGYKLALWGTKWWIKDKFIAQFWHWVEWTQFVDANWKELKADRFNKWEIVYLRVPKKNISKQKDVNKREVKNQNETKNVPWKFSFIKNMKDNQNRNWKIYSYTLLSWWNDRWIEDKFQNQFWAYKQYLLPGRNFCDKNWNNINKRNFSKWETVYIKVPNRDIVDNVPQMTISDIKKLSDDKVKNIFNNYKKFEWWDASPSRWSLYEHADKNWRYLLINGKKLYYYTKNKYINKQPCYFVDECEGVVDSIVMWQYDWKNFDCVQCDFRGVRRWTNVLRIKM